MAAWGGLDEPYTADDQTLLRAIDVVEGRISTQAMGRDTELALQELIINKPAFQIIRDNDHLRGLLRAFLEANIRVERANRNISRESNKGFIGKMLTKSKLEDLQGELAALKVPRDEGINRFR